VTDDEIKALLPKLFRAANMPVDHIELLKNEFGETEALLLFRPSDEMGLQKN
jgi:hypothetical protein